MFDNIQTQANGVLEWFKKLFTIIYEFLGKIGVEA